MQAKDGARFRAPRTLRAVVLAVAVVGTMLQAGTAVAAPPSPDQLTHGDAVPAKPKAKPAPKVDLTRPARTAAAAEACSGPLADNAVVSCDAINEGESHSYTVTTSAPGERLLIRLTVPAENWIEASVADAEPFCIVERYSVAGCTFPSAGTHALTVTSNSGTGPYSISGTSVTAADCTALTTSDLSPAAAGTSSTLAPGSAGDCFQFGGAAEDRIRFGAVVASAQVFDAVGESVCAVSFGGGRCTLTGQAPYRAFVTQLSGAESGYTFRLAKLNDPTGCASLGISSFGTPAAVATGQLGAGQTACRTIEVSSGLYAVRTRVSDPEQAGPIREVFAPNGDEACAQYTANQTCDLQADGTYLVVLEQQDAVTVTFDLSAVGLSSDTGCAPAVPVSWSQPAIVKVATTRLDLHCQPITAAAGERIVVRSLPGASGPTASTRVVGPSGAEACEGSAPTDCVLTGTGPYRVLSETGMGVGEYSVEVGPLTNRDGCVPAVVTSFNTAPPTAATGSRCRELTVGTAATFVIDGNGNSSPVLGPLGADGSPVCSDSQFCELPAGQYLLVAADSARIAIFPRTSTTGCAPQGADTFSARSGELTSPSQYDCVTLSSPAGAVVSPTEPAGQTKIDGTILDASGNGVCSWESWNEPMGCTLTGPSPYRAIIHRGEYQEGNTYRFAVPRTDTAAGCRTLVQRDFTTTGGTSVTMGADRFVSCFVVPAGQHSATEAFQYADRNGAAPVWMTVSEVGDSRRCLGPEGTAEFTFCTLTEGTAYVVHLVGADRTADYRLARRDITSTARGCTPVSSVAVGAISGTGKLADNSALRCFTVPAAPTDRFAVNTRDANHSVGAAVVRPGGEVFCKTFSEMRCAADGSAGYQVVVWNDGNFGAPGAFTLETTRYATAGGPAAGCTTVPSVADGFGPELGQLSAAKPTACLAFPMGRFDRINGFAKNQVEGGPVPYLFARTTGGADSCMWGSDPLGNFSCSASGEPVTQVLLLGLPERVAGPLRYTVTGTCESSPCGGG